MYIVYYSPLNLLDIGLYTIIIIIYRYPFSFCLPHVLVLSVFLWFVCILCYAVYDICVLTGEVDLGV